VDKPVARSIRVVCAIIEHDGRYLITQRRESAALPLLWEFPGGRVEEGESHHEALKREVKHRLNITIAVQELVSFVSHPYESYTVDLYLYGCSIVSEQPEPANVRAFRWVTSGEFDHYDFTPADEISMSKILGIDTLLTAGTAGVLRVLSCNAGRFLRYALANVYRPIA
jgi:8-oxo-dGTP diphosphatase